MDDLLKAEIVVILDAYQRGDAPAIENNEIKPQYAETLEYKFDLVDSKDGAPVCPFETGTAHYINGNEHNTYQLKIICYDDFLHQFTYDDGKGHSHVNRLRDGIKMADFLIYDKSNGKTYFLVHELSDEKASKKIKVAKKQLSDTLNQLYKSPEIARFIDGFTNKICFLSAKDNRDIVETAGMADGFNQIYQVFPEPFQFNFGQIRTHNFVAFETSYVQLMK